jgi:endogenous inhibitor of DNA gyrase (YacG/DUF329 family)
MSKSVTKKNSTLKGSEGSTSCRHCGKQIPIELGPNGPVCSHNCKMQDLSKWCSEGYRIAAGPAVTSPDQPEDAE